MLKNNYSKNFSDKAYADLMERVERELPELKTRLDVLKMKYGLVENALEMGNYFPNISTLFH